MSDNSVLNPWEELIQTCVLGTNRRQPQISAPGSLGALLTQIQAPSEEKLLMTLAATSVAIRVGQVPRRADTLPPAPPPVAESNQKICSTYALTLLNNVLTEQSKGSGAAGDSRKYSLLKHWLNCCRQAGQRIAPEYLSRLIEEARTIEIHRLIEECGGNHYKWLLDLNKTWKRKRNNTDIAAGTAAELVEQIELGDNEIRGGAFISLRHIDAEKARNCLLNIWEKESHEQRAVLTLSLKYGLSFADELFLEEYALNDKRKEVRQQAAKLLAKIPQSRLVARMEERAARYLSRGANNKLQINLPAELDKDMVRDGIEENINVDSRMGQKAGWLYQTVSAIDPAFWTTKFNLDAGRFLKLVLASDEWALPLTLAILNATAENQNHVFQDAIITCDEIHLTESNAGRSFLHSLPAEKLEQLISRRLPTWSQTDRRSAPRLDLWYYLELVDFQWSESFSFLIWQFIIKEIREKVPVFGHTFQSNAGNFGLRMHPSVGNYLPDLPLGQQEMDIYTRNALERFADNLRLRFEIQKSFQENN